jgi:hypothetical protein
MQSPETKTQLNRPPLALTNLVNGKARKPNHDVTAVRVATTTDGIHFMSALPAASMIRRQWR